jgi:hypothetical protein
MANFFAAVRAIRRFLAAIWNVFVIVHDTLAGVTVATIILLLLCFGGAHAAELAPRPMPAPHRVAVMAPLPPDSQKVPFLRCNYTAKEIHMLCAVAVAELESR